MKFNKIEFTIPEIKIHSENYNIQTLLDIKKFFKTWKNPSPYNESKMLGAILPIEMWLVTIAFLDSKSTIFFIQTCKKFNNISNDPRISSKLNIYKGVCEIRQSFQNHRAFFEDSATRPPSFILSLPFDLSRETPLAPDSTQYNNSEFGFTSKS